MPPCELPVQKFFHNTISVLKFHTGRMAFPRGQLVFGSSLLGGQINDPAQQASPSCAPGGPDQMTTQKGFGIRLAAFLLACFGVFVVLFSLSGGTVVPGQEGYRVEAIVPNAYGLSKNADIRQAGVKIGKVTEIRNARQHDGR